MNNFLQNPLLIRRLLGGMLLLALTIWLAGIVPSREIGWVMALLIFTVYLFVFEIVSLDVAAILVMVLLGLSPLLGPYLGIPAGLVDKQHIFDGFASNAVLSIIAVMIIGAGLDKTGLMNTVASLILRLGGNTESRLMSLVSAAAGLVSSFMQNVGAAALFLPVVSRISSRTGLPMSRLLMPMGFCVILGGTITLVGSSPLILLNDLIETSNRGLPPEQQMSSFGLFSVTPVGLALLASGVVYFLLAGRFVLPAIKTESSGGANTMAYFKEVYGVDYDLNEIVVRPESPLVGQTVDDVEIRFKIRIIAIMRQGNDLRIGPGGVARDAAIGAGDILGVIGSHYALRNFVDANRLTVRSGLRTFIDSLVSTKAGIAELVIPPSSNLIGKSARDIWMRKTYGISLLAIHRSGTTIREGEGVRNIPFQAGDTLVVHTSWDGLTRLKTNRNFVVVTSEYPHEELRPNKVPHAVTFFLIAFILALFTELQLSIALFTGALGMVLTRVLSIDEAYQAVSWKTVFILACLIPLGIAVETSGTAAWLAQHMLDAMQGVPVWVLQLAVAILASLFSLVLSNVGATIILVPLAVNIALGVGASPALFALTVAITASNAFLIPTNQVNALIMGPGGYRVKDFLRAGGIMTVLFLGISILLLNLLY